MSPHAIRRQQAALCWRIRTHAGFARVSLDRGDLSGALDSVTRVIALAKLAGTSGARRYAEKWIAHLTDGIRAARAAEQRAA